MGGGCTRSFVPGALRLNRGAVYRYMFFFISSELVAYSDLARGSFARVAVQENNRSFLPKTLGIVEDIYSSFMPKTFGIVEVACYLFPGVVARYSRTGRIRHCTRTRGHSICKARLLGVGA